MEQLNFSVFSILQNDKKIKIISNRKHILISPASHYVTTKDKMERAIGTIEKEMEERVKYFKSKNKLIEAQRIEERTNFDMEMTKEESRKEKDRMNPKVFMYGIFIFIFIATYGVFNNNMSFLIESRGIGDAATSGTVTALFLVGGVLGGLIFGPLNKKLNDYMYCVGFGFLVIGYLLVYAANGLPILFLGAVISGMSISQCMPQSLLGATNCSKVAAVTAACMVIHVGGQLGTFLGTYFYTPVPLLFSDSVDFRYVFAAAMAAIMVVVCAVCVTIANKKESSAA